MNETRYEPVPWRDVALAVLLGLILSLSRLNLDLGRLDPFFEPVSIAIFVLLLLGIPLALWRRRPVPVWPLIPAGLLAWMLIFALGMSIASLLPGRLQAYGWALVVGLHLLLAAVLFAILLRGRRWPSRVWIWLGAVVLAYVLALLILNLVYPDARTTYLTGPESALAAISGPVEGLFLVAVGLLAARRHHVLALLFVLGGYSYLFTDSDYLFGSPERDWPWLSVYLAGMAFLFLVLAPVGLLRARTRAGRAAGLFAPVAVVLAGRLVIPALVVSRPVGGPGDILISVTVLLSLAVGWTLYSHMEGTATREISTGTPGVAPSPG